MKLAEQLFCKSSSFLINLRIRQL